MVRNGDGLHPQYTLVKNQKDGLWFVFLHINHPSYKIPHMDPSLVSLSKFLSLVLRHKPETIDIKLDRHGWADIDELLEAANRAGKQLTSELLFRVIDENDKQRFTLNEDETKVRANQGHSVDVDLGLSAKEPPNVLFHGTVKRFLESIRSKGLLPRNRQYVHLSPDLKTATDVGKRRGRPIILRIAASEMSSDGFEFYLSKNGVWLTDKVPSQYVAFPTNEDDAPQ